MNENIVDFCHLHVHTEYSTLDGINHVSRIPAYAKSLGMKAIAQTDHGNMSGSYAFYKQCIKDDIKPILGIEAYYTMHDRTVKEKDEFGNNYYHLVLLAKNATGLKNLMKLSSFAYTTGFYHKPRIDDNLLQDYSEGVIATSACLGSAVSQLILAGNKKLAEKVLLHHAEMFKDNFFIELQLHDGEQQIVNKVLVDCSKKYNIPSVIVNDCHYMEEGHKHIHEQALGISTNSYMYEEPYDKGGKRFSFGDIDVHFASGEWMLGGARYFELPEECVSNSVHIAESIDASSYFNDIKNRWPKYTFLPEGMKSWEALSNLAKNNLDILFKGNTPKNYQIRLNEELKMLKKLDFCDYLLIQADIINIAKSNKVFVGPGRGSAAGLLTAYAIGITDVDPIVNGLLASRFANEGRGAIPIIGLN